MLRGCYKIRLIDKLTAMIYWEKSRISLYVLCYTWETIL